MGSVLDQFCVALGDLQKVWVVEPTAYDMYGIRGIYDSLEAAKASMPEITAWVEAEGEWWTLGDVAMDESGAHIYEVGVETLESVRRDLGHGRS